MRPQGLPKLTQKGALLITHQGKEKEIEEIGFVEVEKRAKVKMRKRMSRRGMDE